LTDEIENKMTLGKNLYNKWNVDILLGEVNREKTAFTILELSVNFDEKIEIVFIINSFLKSTGK
jgi:hypothetical protein